jgi:hypothetical protein
VRSRRITACSQCGFEASEQLIRLVRERGADSFTCPACAKRVVLVAAGGRTDARARAQIPQIDRSANAERDLQAAASTLQGKEAIKEFDVFLAHNRADKRAVAAIGDALKQRGLNPWLDSEQIPPGRWFQDVIQQAIPQVQSAAVFIGTHGVGNWQQLELRTFVAECVDAALPVIPVLLPGVDGIPVQYRFLRELNWVRFGETLNDPGALDALEWGITGRRTSNCQMLWIGA